MAITGEVVRFDLSSYRSTVTREMAQVRLRLTARAFLAGAGIVAANSAGGALEVDAAALTTANERVRSELVAGPERAILCLRSLSTERLVLDRVASTFGGALARGDLPRAEHFVVYVLAAAHDQALGALKFCLPFDLRPRLQEWVGDPGTVDALLAQEGPTLWSVLRRRELALARLRQQAPAAAYRRRLARHQREYGYLGAEDVDFAAHETVDAIDARLVAIGDPAAVASERRRLAAALAGDRARKAAARQVLADRLASMPPAGDTGRILSNVLLARALTAHEDQNRRAKMRFLRDLRDVAVATGLDIESAGLAAFEAVCGARRPVLRSA